MAFENENLKRKVFVCIFSKILNIFTQVQRFLTRDRKKRSLMGRHNFAILFIRLLTANSWQIWVTFTAFCFFFRKLFVTILKGFLSVFWLESLKKFKWITLKVLFIRYKQNWVYLFVEWCYFTRSHKWSQMWPLQCGTWVYRLENLGGPSDKNLLINQIPKYFVWGLQGTNVIFEDPKLILIREKVTFNPP
jgi:hypothetical protein